MHVCRSHWHDETGETGELTVDTGVRPRLLVRTWYVGTARSNESLWRIQRMIALQRLGNGSRYVCLKKIVRLWDKDNSTVTLPDHYFSLHLMRKPRP